MFCGTLVVSPGVVLGIIKEEGPACGLYMNTAKSYMQISLEHAFNELCQTCPLE